jgi:hypothetical protein
MHGNLADAEGSVRTSGEELDDPSFDTVALAKLRGIIPVH